jgi:hypothetical protein
MGSPTRVSCIRTRGDVACSSAEQALGTRGRKEEPGRALDAIALVAATVIPVLMARLAGLNGVIQRLMFLVAYLWYAREALLLRQRDREAPDNRVQPTPASGASGTIPRRLVSR